MNRISNSWPRGEVHATLNNTPSSRALLAALPIRGVAETWGDEVYFDIGIQPALEADARQVVDAGAICIWVEGSSLAVPFGPTPISVGSECGLVTAVNVLGQLDDDPRLLGELHAGDPVTDRLAQD